MRPGSHTQTPSVFETAEPAPSGMPDEQADEETPLGVPPDEEEPERELPGFPEGDIDTAG